jgi:uncharacterized protein YndB with AHSA1/START domain
MTAVVVTKKPLELVITRTFDAPRSLVPPERLTFAAKIHGGNEVRTTVIFTEEANGTTTITARQTYSFESDATRGAAQGWTSTLDQIAAQVRGS